MAASTDFVPFATAGGANVVSQATYLAESVLGSGFVPGVAPSSVCNKVWRQGTFQGAVLANFVADQLSINVPDDGNLSAAVTNLTNAVIAAASNASNLSSGIIPVGRLPATINSDTTGNANTAYLAAQLTVTPQSANSFYTLALITSGTTVGYSLYNNISFNPSTGQLNVVGNISAGSYLEQGSANSENPTISQVMVTNGTDNVLRKADVSALSVALGGSGSWTTTVTGPFSGSGTLKWERQGTQVTIWCDTDITGTAVTSALMALSALPSQIIPSSNRTVPCCALKNNSVIQTCGSATINAGGTISVGVSIVSGGFVQAGDDFTGSGTAGISAGWSITYSL
jgi:hypothetical protein